MKSVVWQAYYSFSIINIIIAAVIVGALSQHLSVSWLNVRYPYQRYYAKYQ